MTQFDDQNPEETKRTSNAYRAAMIVFGAALVVVTFYLLLAWQMGAWQMYALSGVIALFIVDNFLAMRAIQAGQTNRGGWMILIGMMVVFPAAALLVASVGLIFGIVLPVLCIAVATQTLSRRQARRANIVSIVVGVLTALLDLLPLEYRLLVPQIQAFVPSVAALIVVAVVFFAVRQNWQNIRNFMRSSIRNRLTVIVVGAAILPVLLISIILAAVTYTQVRDALLQDAFDKLEAVHTIKKNQISSYLAEREDDMNALAETTNTFREKVILKMDAVNTLKDNQLVSTFAVWDEDVRDVASDPGVVAGIINLESGFQSLGPDRVRSLYLDKPELGDARDETVYSLAHAEQHEFFSGYTDIHGFEDAFLIDLAGNVVYSAHKTDLFGTNLASGPYSNSNLAELYQNLKNTPADQSLLADAALLLDGYKMFIGSPIFSEGTLVGMLVYQLPLSEIDTIIQDRTGLTSTAESYLVGQTDQGVQLRSNRVVKEGAIGDPKPGDYEERALAGENGHSFQVGSTGNYEIAVYQPLEIPGLNWAISTTESAVEVFSPLEAGKTQDYFAQYSNNFGYYDLFLISPVGEVFYSVAQEAEYGTNILTGPYSDSNLAALIDELSTVKDFEFEDFAYYEPSDAAAGFFGVPLANENNEIILYVVVQVSLEDLNEILQETTGLGQSGETYLIGPDKLWRNDSRHLADLGVDTTVLNEEFKVDTVAANEALAGQSGQGTILGYRGTKNVLSVWSPIAVDEPDAVDPNGRTWAIIAAIDEEEALGPVNQLASVIGLAIGLAVLVLGALAVFIGVRFATGFVNPILSLTDTATKVAGGDLSLRVQTDSQDELGTLSNTFNSMTAQLENTLEGLEQRVADRTKALATSAEVTRRLASILDPRQLASEVVEQVQRSFNYYYAQIYLLDEAGDNLVLSGGTGEAGAAMMARGHAVQKGRGLVGRAADANRSVLVEDTQNEEGWLPNELLPDTRAEAAVPISIGNQVFGVLDVQHSYVGGLTPEDVTLLESLAGQVAISLQNARSYEQSRKQAEMESLVNVIGQRIQRATSIEDTLQTAIRELGTAIGATRVKATLKPASETATAKPLQQAEAQAVTASGNGGAPHVESTHPSTDQEL